MVEAVVFVLVGAQSADIGVIISVDWWLNVTCKIKQQSVSRSRMKVATIYIF